MLKEIYVGDFKLCFKLLLLQILSSLYNSVINTRGKAAHGVINHLCCEVLIMMVALN